MHGFHWDRVLSFIEAFGCLQNSLCRQKSGKGCLTWMLHSLLITCTGYHSADSSAGGAPCFSPVLPERSLKTIPKNTRAIFTTTGHSGISQCFLRLVPNSSPRSGYIHGHWTSKPGPGRGEYYPRAQGLHIPKAEEHRASHIPTAGHITAASLSPLDTTTWAEGGSFAGAAAKTSMQINGMAVFKHLLAYGIPASVTLLFLNQYIAFG